MPSPSLSSSASYKYRQSNVRSSKYPGFEVIFWFLRIIFTISTMDERQRIVALLIFSLVRHIRNRAKKVDILNYLTFCFIFR